MSNQRYTCSEYREEMILLGLRQRLASPDLSDREKQDIEKQILSMEASMGFGLED